MKPAGDPVPRLMSRVAIVLGGTGCWEWRGQILKNGYGYFWFNGKKRYAHRVSYELFRGAIPAGLDLDHLCRVRHCVHPDHLEAVTRSENLRRGPRVAVTHCPRGHEYTPENTRVNRGKRQCRTCDRMLHQRKRDAAR